MAVTWYITAIVLTPDTQRVKLELNYPESELVFGLVYAAGTDYTGIQLTIENFVKRFNYKPKAIRVSKFISKVLEKVSVGVVVDESTEFNRVDTLMTAGNKLCELAKDPAFLIEGVVSEINRERPNGDNGQEPIPRTAHILLSLKRPAEVELLRAIYGSGFYLIGIFASEEGRLRYLTKDKNIPLKDALRLIRRDEDEELPFGQRSRDTFQLADVFIQLEPEQYKEQLERFLDLIFGNPFLTPEPDEHAMFLAYAASLRSGQLARQVGSAIRSADGDIIAVGCNDVPKAGGGLYWPGPDDARDHILTRDSNDMEQLAIVKDIIKKLDLTIEIQDAMKKLKNSRLMDITEYGRAVHAEMEALLACARVAVSPVGATLFTTTFPCHNCTRHLIASGIKRVVYIEPYPKSFASKLHKDSIQLTGLRSFQHKDSRFRIPFQPFVGIGPRRFFDLFSMKLGRGYLLTRKQTNGRLWPWKRDQSSPRMQMVPTSYAQREKLAAARFKSTIDGFVEEQSGIHKLPFEKN